MRRIFSTILGLILYLSVLLGNGTYAQIYDNESRAYGDIHAIVLLLSSDITEEANKAKTELVKLGQETPGNRELIINDLIKSLEPLMPVPGREKSVMEAKAFRLWKNANYIFSRLKAIEAIDLVVNCIYCSSGIVGDQPAYQTLVLMGNSEFQAEVVAKLSFSLRNGTIRATRSFSALILGDIGGGDAEAALKTALAAEPDEEVRRSVKQALEISGNPRSRKPER